MYLRIKKAKTLKTTYWNNIVISMIWLYDNNHKRVKRIRLDEITAEMLTTMPIHISDGNTYYTDNTKNVSKEST